MYCMKCNHHVANCTCPDIQERLAGIGGAGTHTAAKFCRKCNQHYARCKCAEPDFFIKIQGQELPMSALEDGTLQTLEQVVTPDHLNGKSSEGEAQ